MTANVDSGVIDGGLNLINTTAAAIYVCATEPSTFSNCTAGLGWRSFTAGTTFGAPATNGTARRVGSTAITDGTILTTGTASFWAVANATVMMAHGLLSAAQAVTATNVFTLGQFFIQIPWQ